MAPLPALATIGGRMIWKTPLVFSVVFSIVFSIMVLDRDEQDDLGPGSHTF